MAMELRRTTDNSLISDKIFWFEGWAANHPKTDIGQTVNAVTYLQERGRMEWQATVTFMFCDSLPTSPADNRYALIRYARRREWLKFTDKDGDLYDVRVKNGPLVPERDENSSGVAIYYIDAVLLMRGYE